MTPLEKIKCWVITLFKRRKGAPWLSISWHTWQLWAHHI
jgi:hypothetical protein